MNRLLTRGAFALALALVLSLPARAATTTTPVTLSATSYTDLGVGPMYVGAAGGPVVYAIADTQPAGTSQGLGAVYPSAPASLLSTTSHIWAKAAIPGASAVVSAGTGIAIGGGSVTVSNTNPNGSATSANSSPVVIASDQLVNLGTIGAAATAANQATLLTALGSPFQAGGSIGNTAFGISGTLPAFATTPTFNIGTAPSIVLATGANTIGAISNTSFAATQSGTWNIGTITTLPATPAGTNTIGNVISAPTSSSSLAVSHASVTVLGTSLVAKASAGNLYGFNCTALTGGAAGYCIAYNGTAAPSTGALTGSLVLDVCYFAAGAAGCSLSHGILPANYSAGIVILATSAATPFTYTTGVDTAFISADYN